MIAVDATALRTALARLSEPTSHGETPAPKDVYLPRPHLRALDPDALIVIGMRGAGKTFWWSALQDTAVRQLVGASGDFPPLSEKTEVRTGFGVRPAIDEYPDKDTLRQILNRGQETRILWRTVQAWRLAEGDHPIRYENSWPDRVEYVAEHPEEIARLFQHRDAELERKGIHLLILFDALDRCADDRKDMYQIIRGLLQTAVDMRPYRRLRVKVFLRSDQVDALQTADFADASKMLASAVELSWPRRDLYGLLWHLMSNGDDGDRVRAFLGKDEWSSVAGARTLFAIHRPFIADEERQRERFHALAGPWMGSGRRRGFPYSWIPNHLGDTEGRVSPRSFLGALRQAAEDTSERFPDHEYALHYNSIKRGVQEASGIRVAELREDYPWVDHVFEPLRGMTVPCEFREIKKQWRTSGLLDDPAAGLADGAMELPPSYPPRNALDIRADLESLGIFQRLHDSRVNIPDVFRVGYGLGRKGGVKPVR